MRRLVVLEVPMASSLFMFVDPDQYIVTGLIAIDVFAAIGYLDKNFARISSTENPPPLDTTTSA